MMVIHKTNITMIIVQWKMEFKIHSPKKSFCRAETIIFFYGTQDNKSLITIITI